MPNLFDVSVASERAVFSLLISKARTATVYLSKTLTVRAARRVCNGKFHDRAIEVSLTIGRPNSAGRAFVKKAIKAGEPFPVKKVQLTFLRAK